MEKMHQQLARLIRRRAHKRKILDWHTLQANTTGHPRSVKMEQHYAKDIHQIDHQIADLRRKIWRNR